MKVQQISDTRVFYQFHECSISVHDSSKSTWHVAHFKWIFTSWIFPTNFIKHFARCEISYFQFFYLPSQRSLVSLLFVFTSKPLVFMLIFLWPFVMVPQSWKQALPILLLSLIVVHCSKQHKPNVVGVRDLMDSEWVFGHIKSHVWHDDLQNHWTLLGHINNDVQVIIADMMVG
jgi:hypothetical protein